MFRYEPCAHSLPPLHSSAVALSPFVQRLPPERIDPPFPPPCVRPRTPPSAAYKSRVFNYPASTGRITNAHAMENIPRLPARPPAFAARAYNTPLAGVARMNVNANTRGGRLTLYDVTRPDSHGLGIRRYSRRFHTARHNRYFSSDVARILSTGTLPRTVK